MHVGPPATGILDFEVKTTSSKSANIYGNRIAPQTGKSAKGSFLLAVQYERADLSVRSVRFGWVDTESWIAQAGNGQQAHLSEAALAQLIAL